MTPEPGMVVAGKYRLLRPLAAGGMGSVWVGQHTELEVEVAVKFMAERALQLDMSRARFKREARAAAQLKSPHVTQIHDYGIFEGTPYIAMELLEGQSLEELLASKKALPLDRVVDIVTQLCRGLKLAHDKGIIHRDLKPSNVFLAQSGDHEVVKILDFGVAKERDPRLVVGEETATGALVGSPRYMSPEQATGSDLDHRTDLWSLGVVIYEMLSGRRPFEQEHLGQLITAICAVDVLPVRMNAPALPAGVDEFMARAMARRADDRFQSAGELARALEAVAEGRPIVSEPLKSDTAGRLEATGDMPETKVKSHDSVSSTTAFGETQPLKRDEGTTPGVGLDSSAGHRSSRKWIIGLSLAMVAAALGGVMLRRGENETSAPTAEPARAETPEPASAAPVEEPAPKAAPPPAAPPPVASSATPQPRMVAPSPKAIASAPPKTVPPKPATSVVIDGDFGLPVRK
ncbi:MAG TPA: serine/threonine-protein kinase [Polyangiaceae bacterium]|nr:serine/threonine-protein kinase [Polyangiaceae bacterium]